MPLLDRTRTGEDEPVRWKPSGIPLPSKELSGGRAVEDKGMRITILGALLILAVVVLLALWIQSLLGEGGSDKRNLNQSNL